MEMGGEANVFGSCLYVPSFPLDTQKPLENRLLAGCHVMPVIMNYARTLMEFIYLL